MKEVMAFFDMRGFSSIVDLYSAHGRRSISRKEARPWLIWKSPRKRSLAAVMLAFV